MARRKSGPRGGPRHARDRPFAKPCAAWHIYQVCSLICQVAQNANFKCKTIGYLFLRFFGKLQECKVQMQNPWRFSYLSFLSFIFLLYYFYCHIFLPSIHSFIFFFFVFPSYFISFPFIIYFYLLFFFFSFDFF